MISDDTFTLHQTTRRHLITYLDTLSPEQLAFIPNGFHNNILWNIAHCIVTQQILCYKLSSLPLLISDTMVERYKKGTTPIGEILSLEEIQEIRNLLTLTQEQLQQDFQQGKFTQYTPYPTSYGFEISSIEDAITFNNVHEGMHLGIIKALCYFKR